MTTKLGAISIRNKKLNEIMHNPVGPWVEANSLYIDQSNLRQKLVASPAVDPFVIYDVGLGAAANALAVLACVDELGETCRPVQLVSFERDMELLRFACANASEFPHFAKYQGAVRQILEVGSWSSQKVQWRLHEGDFLNTLDLEMEKPHLIFYDPYSPKVNRDMWSTACFTKIKDKCRTEGVGDCEGTTLLTYSRATGIRVSLLLAGFFVGYGRSTGAKSETTVASTTLKELKAPLDEAWYKRFRLSHLRYPFDCQIEDHLKIDSFIENYRSRHFCDPRI